MASTLDILRSCQQTLRRRAWWILSLSLLLAAIAAFMTRSMPGQYQTYAKIFPLAINKAGGGSAVDAIRSQFGISDKTDYDKIYNVHELVNSKTVSQLIVRTRTTHPKFKTLAEWLIDDYNHHVPFWKNPLKPSADDANDLYYQGASILLKQTTVKNDPKTGFTSIYTRSGDTALTQVMNETILDKLSDFYIQLVTEKPRTDLEKIRLMRDSLQQELIQVERQIAGFIDANQLSVKSVTQVPQFRLMRAQKEIESLYTTAATSYQNARFKLLSESPIFQVLDAAGPPYAFTKPSWKKNALLMLIVGLLLGSLLACRRIIGQLLMEELSRS